jgi:hypothetical protein
MPTISLNSAALISTPTKLSNADLTAKALQHNADLLFR